MILTFWRKIGPKNSTFFRKIREFFQCWRNGFSWWFWGLGKKIRQKIKTFFRKFFENFFKKLMIFYVIDSHNLKEIIKFRRKSWCLYFICDFVSSNFLQIWDTVFREGLKFVIWEPSVNFHTSKISKLKNHNSKAFLSFLIPSENL